MPPLRTALLQSSGRPGSVAENLKVLDEAAGSAAAAGAGLLICPEMFLTGYAIGDEVPRAGRARRRPRRPGRRRDRRAATASRSMYGYPERDGETDLQLRAADRPRRREPRELPQDPSLRLLRAAVVHPGRAARRPGRARRVRIGMLICYDVEFPENVRAHALAGTDLLLVPTAQMHPFQFVAESVVPVRAFESQMYIAYVNRTGPEGRVRVRRTQLPGRAPTAPTRARAGPRRGAGRRRGRPRPAERLARDQSVSARPPPRPVRAP